MQDVLIVSIWEFLARKLLVEASGFRYWLSCIALTDQGHAG